MGWLDIMNILSKVPESGALKIHLEAAWRESDKLNEKIANLADEIASLNRDNRELRTENEELKVKLSAYNNKTIPIDIGPCSVKKHKDGTIINGFYCNKCLDLLSLDETLAIYHCGRCKVYINEDEVSAAKKIFQDKKPD